MKCNACDKIILDDSNYCPYCGEDVSKVESLIKSDDYISNKLEQFNLNHNKKTITNKNTSSNTLILGIFTFVLGLIFNGFLSVIIVLFSIYVIYTGVKNKKNESKTKIGWGLVLAGVALFLASINVAIFGISLARASNATSKYTEELDIQLPDITPAHYYRDNALYPEFECNYTKFVYILTDRQEELFSEEVQRDYRWSTEQFSGEISQMLKLEAYGIYICYDRVTESFGLPNNPDNYDFVIIIFDEENNEIVILDISERE